MPFVPTSCTAVQHPHCPRALHHHCGAIAVPAMGEHLDSIAGGATCRVQAAMAYLRSRHDQDFISKQLPLSSQPPSDQHGDGGTTAVTVCVLHPPVASTPPHRPPPAHV